MGSRARSAFNWLLLCSALIAGLAACGTERERAFQQVVDGDFVSGNLELQLVTDLESIDASTTIDFLLENHSANRVEFGADFGIEIYAYSMERGVWERVENGINYQPPDEVNILEPRTEVPFNQIMIGIWPRPGTSLEGRYVRVVVQGTEKDLGGSTSHQIIAVTEFTWPEASSK
jgi:hypothetical protein